MPESTSIMLEIDVAESRAAEMNALLKRIALLFDHIYYVLPDFWTINEELYADTKRFEIDEYGVPVPLPEAGLDPGQHLRPALEYPEYLLANELQETLHALTENKIASKPDTYLYNVVTEGQHRLFRKLRHSQLWSDLRDKDFLARSGTRPEDALAMRATLEFLQGVEGPDSPVPTGEERALWIAMPSNAFLCSNTLSNMLYGSSKETASPLFIRPEHRSLMELRFQQLRQAQSRLTEITPRRVDMAFGEYSFQMLNGVVSSELLRSRSIEEIIRYRQAMDPARQRLVSESVITSHEIISGNPWNAETREAIENHVSTHVIPNLVSYEEEWLAAGTRCLGPYFNLSPPLLAVELLERSLGTQLVEPRELTEDWRAHS